MTSLRRGIDLIRPIIVISLVSLGWPFVAIAGGPAERATETSETRGFKVDTNAFYKNLQTAVKFAISNPNAGWSIDYDDYDGLSTNRFFPSEAHEAFYEHLKSHGVDVDGWGKRFDLWLLDQVFANGSKKDLELVEAAIRELNRTPGEIKIRLQILEVPPEPHRPRVQISGINADDIGDKGMALTDSQAKALLSAVQKSKGAKILLTNECTVVNGCRAQVDLTERQQSPNSGYFRLGETTNFTLNLKATVHRSFDFVPYLSEDNRTLELRLTSWPTADEGQQFDGARSLTSKTVIWDGQTIVTKQKVTEIPADATGQPVTRAKRNALVFITLTAVDAKGRPLHGDDDLPQRLTSFPFLTR